MLSGSLVDHAQEHHTVPLRLLGAHPNWKYTGNVNHTIIKNTVIHSSVISISCMMPKSPLTCQPCLPVTNMSTMWKKSTMKTTWKFQWHVNLEHAPSMFPYLIESGGVNRMIVSWVGLARTLSFNCRQISYAEIGHGFLLLSSTALNKPLPRTSRM